MSGSVLCNLLTGYAGTAWEIPSLRSVTESRVSFFSVETFSVGKAEGLSSGKW